MKRKMVGMLDLRLIDSKVQSTLSFSKLGKAVAKDKKIVILEPTPVCSVSAIPASVSAIPASVSAIPASVSAIPASVSAIPASVSAIPASATVICTPVLPAPVTYPKPELSMINAASIEFGGGGNGGVVLSDEQKPWTMHVSKIIGHAMAVKHIKEWAVNEPRTPLLICGHVGCGKTALARAALKACKVSDIWDARVAFEKAPSDVSCMVTLKQFMETADADSCAVFMDEFETMDGTERGNVLKFLKTVDFSTAPRMCITVGDEDYKLVTSIQTATKATTVKLWRPNSGDMSDMHALATHVLNTHGAKLSAVTLNSIVACSNGDRRKLINMLEWECRTGQAVADARFSSYDAFVSPWTEAACVMQGVKLDTMVDHFLSPLLLLENYPKFAANISACAYMSGVMSDAAETNYDAVPIAEHLMLRSIAHAALSKTCATGRRTPPLSFPKGVSIFTSCAKHRSHIRDVIKRTRMSVDVGDIDVVCSILTANVPATGKKRTDMLRACGLLADDVKYVKSRFHKVGTL
jgi:ATPase family associated with various cellular activities (AAA)